VENSFGGITMEEQAKEYQIQMKSQAGLIRQVSLL
jgi:hypothetical protein